MYKNIIIIGGGIGGLLAGALLSKEGQRVTVVEKNATIGGGLQSYQRFGVTFDTGMHVVGGMHSNGNLYSICRYLGILGKIKIMDVDNDCTDRVYVASEDKHYDIAKGIEGFINSLSAYFPHQRNELRNYVNAMIALTQEMDLFYLRVPKHRMYIQNDDFVMSADEFIAKYISDIRLREILSFQSILYAGEKGVTPAYIHAVISILYIEGPSRFVGGSAHFAEALGDIIREAGGEIMTNSEVVKVNVESKTIVQCVTSAGQVLKGDIYISTIHPSSFLKLIDDGRVFTKAFKNRVESIPNTYSALILNIKLKPNSFVFFNHIGHYYNSYDDMWDIKRDEDRWPNKLLYMTLPVENQSRFATTMNIIAPMEWREVSRWENTTVGHRGDDYIKWKECYAAKVIAQMERVYPNLRNCIENIDISSPLTIRDYYGVKHGALYGYKKDCSNLIYSRIPVKTKLSNLFFTGQNHNLHGLCGVSLTAIETCNMVLESNCLLEKIKEKTCSNE